VSDDPILGSLLSDSRVLVRRLLDEPLLDEATLARQLAAHVSQLRLVAGDRSLADWQTGLELTAAARSLLDRWPGLDHRGRRLVQVAVRYLVLEEDGDADLDSPFGFDDDREVIDAVRRALGDGGR
jgi:hypothetical protein